MYEEDGKRIVLSNSKIVRQYFHYIFLLTQFNINDYIKLLLNLLPMFINACGGIVYVVNLSCYTAAIVVICFLSHDVNVIIYNWRT